ncbi:MAG: DsrE/DsrF/DrsH-like family protein [Armatimonadetes bacterium]|nr:DsrE/DsrF/DrsH-like family protein [Armatimonadota bacterium]MDW8121260.1 DsrE/DsrF/DrsH-like family protein [Armatimonadota bacterium]
MEVTVAEKKDERTEVVGFAGLHERIADLNERVQQLETRLTQIEKELPEDRVSIVVFSGDLDKVLPAFIIGTGAAAMGMKVSLFFTFWGLSALKKRRDLSGKGFLEKMFALMTPTGTEGLGVSKMNFFGIGARLLRTMMKRKEVASLEELAQMARDMGVRIIACQMSMDVLGVQKDELWDDVEVGGVAAFLADATKSKVTLFI